MADYGLKIFDAAGNVTLDTTEAISRLVGRWDAEIGSNGNSGNIPEINGKNTVQFAIGIHQFWLGTPHHVYRSDNTICWIAKGWDNINEYPGSVEDGYFGSSLSKILCFVYN